jgi:CDP-diglyceride synthetase
MFNFHRPFIVLFLWVFGLLSHKKRVLLRKYQLMQPTYISNIGLYHAIYSLCTCSWSVNDEWRTVRAVLCMGTMGSWPGIPRSKEPHTNLCMLYTAWYLMLKYWFCWKYQYKKYMFNFIDHLQFYFCECFSHTTYLSILRQYSAYKSYSKIICDKIHRKLTKKNPSSI